jgi:regulatory protein
VTAVDSVLRKTVAAAPAFEREFRPLFTSLLPYFILSFMFSRSRPRKLDSEDELYDVALRALMRRAHSVQEMKQKLARRTDNEFLVRVVMARLKENGQLDDELYARQFTRNRTESRKQGKFRIARELRSRGVPDRLINSALEESTTQSEQAAMVRQRIEHKLKSYRGQIDDKKITSIYGSLLRAGFPSDLIRSELKKLTAEEVPTVEPTEDL